MSRSVGARVQLHSRVGRLLYYGLAFFFLQGLASPGVIVYLAWVRGDLNPSLILLLAQAALAVYGCSWAWRSRGRIWATPEGLEFGEPKQVVPWHEVGRPSRSVMLSSLQPFYHVPLWNRRVPLSFYTYEDLEAVFARFRHAGARTDATPDGARS